MVYKCCVHGYQHQILLPWQVVVQKFDENLFQCNVLKVLSLCLLCTCRVGTIGLFLSLLAIGIYRVSRGTNASPTGISAGVCVWE